MTLISLSALPIVGATSFALKSLEKLRIEPSGENVPLGRQIVFTFNQPVVSIGRKENKATLPITITPALDCQWHWLNTKSLACELSEKSTFKAATRYTIQITPKANIPNTPSKPIQHQFTTQRPAPDYAEIEKWIAPSLPTIRINFNQPVTRDSVTKHLYIEAPNKQRIAITVAPPPSDLKPKNPVLKKTIEQSEIWIATPLDELLNDTTFSLKVEPGLQSIEGPELGNEHQTITTLHTYPKTFKFLGVQCTTLQEQTILIRPQQRYQTKRCNPLRGISLKFTAPILKEAATNLIINPDLTNGRKNYDPWENVSSYSHLQNNHNEGDTYRLWLPSPLKAYHTYHIKTQDIKALTDEFSRPLSTPINIHFATDHRAPNYSFDHDIAILEKNIDSEIPITVTNLQYLNLHYQTLTPKGWTSQKTQRIKVPPIQDIAHKMSLGIRHLLPDTGIIQGHITTQPSIKKDYGYDNQFLAQITPYHIQTKLGHHNTLVWVTDFATGQPIQGATISIYRDSYTPKHTLPTPIATTITDQKGIASLPGTKTLDPHLKTSEIYGFDKETPRFFILAQKEQNRALLPLDSNFRVYIAELTDYTLYPWTKSKYGHIHTWGTTAQGLYKAGDTVQYKIYVRNQDNRAFIPAPRQGYTLKVIDPMGKVAYQIKKFNLSEFGSHHGEFTLPKKATVGWYNFHLTGQFGQHTKQWEPLRILVSDFTPSPFRVKTEINKKLYQPKDSITINTHATYHAGGPYPHAPTRIQAILTPQSLHPNHPATTGFTFDVTAEEIEDQTLFSHENQRLNNKGQLQTTFNLPAQSKILYGQLKIESAVNDARNKKVANMTTARYIGRDRFIGLKETSWVLTAGKEAKVLLLVIDQNNQPITDTDITAKIERRITKGVRIKSAGNAYLTHYEHQWEPIAECHNPAKTVLDSKAIDIAKACTFIPPKAGAYKITATIKDTQGRSHSTELNQWATGSDHVLWETIPGNTLTIIPEQQNYKVGDTARYMIKNPYPGAKALITIERLGTMKSWVQTLENSIETIEVPIEPDYIPGYFISITVISPRIANKPIKDQVDLGKPAFRMGYVKTNVKDPYKELAVNIQTDKTEYRPREQVTLKIQASSQQKNGPAQPIELAITVLDESVFDLLTKGKEYFDPYKGFYTLDNLDITNYSLLMRLVGRQQFEKKGANAGGDGGSIGPEMRTETERFISYWNPSIKTNTEGKAQIQFTLPDNLTGWRVLAIAVTPSDRMGLGDINFKVNKPIEIRPIMPNQLTAGDSFLAGFSVRNTTDKVRELEMTIKASGPVNFREPIKTALIAMTEKATAKEANAFNAETAKSEWTVIEAKIDQLVAERKAINKMAVEKAVAKEATDSNIIALTTAAKKATEEKVAAKNLVTKKLAIEKETASNLAKALKTVIEVEKIEKPAKDSSQGDKGIIGNLFSNWFGSSKKETKEMPEADIAIETQQKEKAESKTEDKQDEQTQNAEPTTSVTDEIIDVEKIIAEYAETLSATDKKIAELNTEYKRAKAERLVAETDVLKKEEAEKLAISKRTDEKVAAAKLANEKAEIDKQILSLTKKITTAIEKVAAMKAEAEKKAAANKRITKNAAILAALSQHDKEMLKKITKARARNAGDTSPSITTNITAHPLERYTQWLPLKTIKAGTIHFTTKVTDGTEGDALIKKLQILPHRPSTTVATYGSTVANEITESIQIPTEIHTNTGGVKVIASPTIISGVEGAFKYMRDYPYACWEQKLSKGTMASHYNNLQTYLADSLTWETSQSLPSKTIELAKEYQTPNGGMAYFIAKNERVSPYLSAYTANAFNWLRSSGHSIPDTIENDLHNYLLKLLRKDVMPNHYSKGMASSVRALALAALAPHGKISRQDINRYKRHIKKMDLFGKSQFLSAALKIPGTGRIRTQVADMILAHANQTSGTISFTETLNKGYKRMLSSSLRTQCAILSSLSQYHATMGQQSHISTIPLKLVRHITKMRKSQGHWENTQENMYCMNALVEYARFYEKENPSYQLTVNSEQLSLINEKSTQSTTFEDVKNPPVTFTHKMTESNPGTKATIKLKREGQGRLYYTVRMNYAEKAEKATAVNAGIQINREYHVERDNQWVQLTTPMEIKTGEIVRIDLYVSLPAPRHFVVVDDPIPGGLEPLNRDLATTSQIDADKASGQYATGSLWFTSDWEEYGQSWWSFYHKELRHHAARFYSDYLPAGNYHLSYVATAITSGEFSVMATHVEEMYEPEIFGKSAPAILKVIHD